MKFFVDNCLPKGLAQALNILDNQNRVVHLREKFSPDIEDSQWITRLAREGDWIIISGDIRITKSPLNRKAWLESGLTAFFFEKGWTNHDLWGQAWRAIKWWPEIIQFASRVETGTGWNVPVKFGSKSGKFKQVVISDK